MGPSLDDEIMKALAKPPVPIILQEPKVDEWNMRNLKIGLMR
jgi:hypothetical protein